MKIYNRFCLPFLFSIGLATISSNTFAGEGLIDHMRGLQYFTHKTGLAIDQKNAKLSSFYAHEIEEILEEVEEIKNYDGHPIGAIAKKILEPAFYDLEESIKDKKWSEASTNFDKLINACNHCHRDTDHSYIKIVRQKDNPYMQSFAP
jgi:hypothetical protein